MSLKIHTLMHTDSQKDTQGLGQQQVPLERHGGPVKYRKKEHLFFCVYLLNGGLVLLVPVQK